MSLAVAMDQRADVVVLGEEDATVSSCLPQQG